MTLCEFYNKLNLPHVYEICGKRDYKFVKLPKFGWYAYTPDHSLVSQFFDGQFSDIEDQESFTNAIKTLFTENKQCFDFKVIYSEFTALRIYRELRHYRKLTDFWNICKAEIRDQPALLGSRQVNLLKRYQDEGLTQIEECGIGLCTERVWTSMNRCKLKLPATCINKVVIPTYSSPRHICSLEVADPLQLINNRHILWTLNNESGWMGNYRPATILPNFSTCLLTPGCTWDPKLDFWFHSAVDIHHNCNASTCLQIWKDAKQTVFVKNPLDTLKATTDVDQIKYNIKELTLKQIKELEDKLEISLIDNWKAQKADECKIGYFVINRKDNQYWITPRFGRTEELTNFAIDVLYLRKDDTGKVWRIVKICKGDQEVEAKIDNADFLSPQKLLAAINDVFMDNGIGVPIIVHAYSYLLLDIINKFNPDVNFE